MQEEAIDAILDGDNVIVLAPTAGGKTEASIFPVLSNMLSTDAQPVAALYVCPIRALLNNQEHRLKRYAGMVGLDAFKWHGDVGNAQRRRFIQSPAHILMTTPESLEVMLINRRQEVERLFAGLQTVIVDEIHAFADDDRGGHLLSVLERLTRFCGRDLQRIGLSATVGNPDEIGAWLAGSSRRAYRRIDPPKPPAQREISIELFEDDEIVGQAAALARGKKCLVFAESRKGVEEIGAALQKRDITTFVHHGSVSREERERAEARFQMGESAAIVCTSTLELGIDIGDLDRVIQIGAPRTVSSVLQRMGRTGRRPGTTSNYHFLCGGAESMLQAIASVRLLEAGWVEDAEPDDAATHLLAHQIMALSLQEQGISRHLVTDWLAGAHPYSGIEAKDVRALIDTMVKRDILYESEGLLSLGDEGERRYGGSNFLELYAVFDTPPMFTVRYGREDVGTLDVAFLRLMDGQDEGAGGASGGGLGGGRSSFRLAGRPWQIRTIDWRRHVCYVEPTRSASAAKWAGTGGYLSWEICQAIKAALADDAEYPWLGRSASYELASLRLGYARVVPGDATVVETTDTGVTWHTFAGGAINALLAEALNADGGDWTRDNLRIKTDDRATMETAISSIRALRHTDLDEVARTAAAKLPRWGLSKFEPCLPEDQAIALVMRRVFDVEGAGRVARSLWRRSRDIGTPGRMG